MGNCLTLGLQGYSLSKLAAEHILYALQPTGGFPLRILRIGQICGDTITGTWTSDDMIPMLLASLPYTGAIVKDRPDVCWIPSDICAETIRDLVAADHQGSGDRPVQVHNLVNPVSTPWHDVFEQVAAFIGCPSPRMVSLAEYVSILEGMSSESRTSINRLLPYFESSLALGSGPTRFAPLEVSRTIKASRSLAECPPIAASFLRLLASKIAFSDNTTGTPSRDVVLCFGPWSSEPSILPRGDYSDDVYQDIRSIALHTLEM